MADEEERRQLGRSAGDSERLFPRFTQASAASSGSIQINGKTLQIWEYAQLEALNAQALRARATAIRDVIGDANCPPMPSKQGQDVIRWILHMQAELANQRLEVGHPKHGRGCAAPAHFLQESSQRPITARREPSPPQRGVPFGPRSAALDHVARRDSFGDLKEHRKEFSEADSHLKMGIESMRPGGEGRRHINDATNMHGVGVSATNESRGIAGGEGRVHIPVKDHLGEHMEELASGYPTASNYRRLNGGPADVHVSNTSMCAHGVSDPTVEPVIAGSRRRHYGLTTKRGFEVSSDNFVLSRILAVAFAEGGVTVSSVLATISATPTIVTRRVGRRIHLGCMVPVSSSSE